MNTNFRSEKSELLGYLTQIKSTFVESKKTGNPTTSDKVLDELMVLLTMSQVNDRRLGEVISSFMRITMGYENAIMGIETAGHLPKGFTECLCKLCKTLVKDLIPTQTKPK